MDKEIISIRMREINRLKIIHQVILRKLTQVKAAGILGLTDRHVRRVVKRVKEEGARGVVHRSRGRASPHRMGKEVEGRIVKLIRTRYLGFGPTLASEKLLERHRLRVGREKLRQIMIVEGLWHVRRRRRKAQPWRERKSYYGEMVQMDGSHHDWLEGRGPKLVFMGYVDDATNHLFGRFYDYEGVYPAMDSLARYIRRYGRPVSLYLDKHSTYKTSREPSVEELLRGEKAQTQFERACRELGIKVIHAHSPQAKGRVERVFGTLQDRLIKEMRLEAIASKEEANELLKRFLSGFNKQFARKPLKEGNLHRRLPPGIKLRDIFCIKAKRTISNGYMVKWRGRQLLIDKPTIVLRRREVEVREYFDGEVKIKFKGRYLKYREITEPKLVARKRMKKPGDKPRKRKGKYIPPADHPWRRHQPSLHHN